LEPHPGRSITSEQPFYITPDVIVKKVDDQYLYYLNEGTSSRLRISPFYRRLLSENNFSKGEKRFALDKYKSAVWLIKNIEKRRNTILKVTEAIINHQKEFLEKGIEYLKPLTLKEIAEVTDLHESTLARVTSGKYVETPRGTFELKYFFSSGLERSDGGEAASSRSTKEMIRQIVSEEDERKPFSDKEIANKLAEKGIRIARRTVAKYREKLGILPAKLRRETL
jgi:RNA polymerase sigma-54 factor